MKCEKCGSDNIEWQKCVNITPKSGTTFHVRYHCLSCNYYKFCERNKERFELTKNTKWVYTKATIKRFKRKEI